MGGPFKMRSGNSPLFKQMGSSPLKQDVPTVQDQTETKKANTVTVEKWNAENAWNLGGKDKYDSLLTKSEFTHQYNESLKRINDANKKLTTKFTDEEKQNIIDKDMKEREDALIRNY